MKSALRDKLVAAVTVALLAVIIYWYFSLRGRHFAAAVSSISFDPGQSPNIVYTLAGPVPADQFTDRSAVLKSFAATAPLGAAGAQMISALLQGPPFTPFGNSTLTQLYSNTLPAGMPTVPASVAGAGIVWLIAPSR